jgi:hypothetical protein
MKPNVLTSTKIAPCGMNCGICLAYLRDKNTCPGCNAVDADKPVYCGRCRIKNCDRLKESQSKFCCACDVCPCTRLKQLDKRYRTKYRMSMIENLESIKKSGIRAFIRQEKKRWTCLTCGEVICVHREQCLFCGASH